MPHTNRKRRRREGSKSKTWRVPTPEVESPVRLYVDGRRVPCESEREAHVICANWPKRGVLAQVRVREVELDPILAEFNDGERVRTYNLYTGRGKKFHSYVASQGCIEESHRRCLPEVERVEYLSADGRRRLMPDSEHTLRAAERLVPPMPRPQNMKRDHLMVRKYKDSVGMAKPLGVLVRFDERPDW
jgi:hypothetical protein